MVIDKEAHREALIGILNSKTLIVPGSAIDLIYELKQAILSASILDPAPGEGSQDNEIPQAPRRKRSKG